MSRKKRRLRRGIATGYWASGVIAVVVVMAMIARQRMSDQRSNRNDANRNGVAQKSEPSDVQPFNAIEERVYPQNQLAEDERSWPSRTTSPNRAIWPNGPHPSQIVQANIPVLLAGESEGNRAPTEMNPSIRPYRQTSHKQLPSVEIPRSRITSSGPTLSGPTLSGPTFTPQTFSDLHPSADLVEPSPRVASNLQRLTPNTDGDSGPSIFRVEPSPLVALNLLAPNPEVFEESSPPIDFEELTPPDPLPIDTSLLGGSGSNQASVDKLGRSIIGEPADLLEGPGHQHLAISLEEVIGTALRFSPTVGIQDLSIVIEKTEIQVAKSRLDWRLFSEFQGLDENTPVETSLDVGGVASRRTATTTNLSVGGSHQNALGGQFRISQEFGTFFSNSTYLAPPDQGNTRFVIRYIQPLLQGAGREVNLSQIATARVNVRSTAESGRIEIQSLLLEVAKLYWNLYGERSNLAISRSQYHESLKILTEYELRQNLNLPADIISQIKGDVTRQAADMVRIEARVRQFQNELIELVGYPGWQQAPVELQPISKISFSDSTLNRSEELRIGLIARPEIQAIASRTESARIAGRVAKNLLLPQLDLVLEGSAAGLSGDFDVGESFVKQFSDGRPSCGIGLQFEVPLGNHEAKAMNRRAALEISRLNTELIQATNRIIRDIDSAILNHESTAELYLLRKENLRENINEVRELEQRKTLATSRPSEAIFFLNRLLQARRRLAESQAALIATEIDHMVSVIELRRANGTLVQALDSQSILAEPCENSVF